jgi:hypothetical protein
MANEINEGEEGKVEEAADEEKGRSITLPMPNPLPVPC